LILLAACNSSDDSIESLQWRGIEHANQGRSKEAIVVFTTILKRDPKNVVALCARGATYGELGMNDKALGDLSAAIPNPAALKNRAVLYKKMQRYEDAIQDSTQLLSIEPRSAPTYALIASCYSALKDFERAATNYKMVSELEPKNAMAFMNYGGMLVELKQYKPAEQAFTQAVLLTPEDYAGWALRYNARWLSGDSEGAESDRRMARKLNPQWGSGDE
jgi:tetratricopeptide (TPR) repeat protein